MAAGEQGCDEESNGPQPGTAVNASVRRLSFFFCVAFAWWQKSGRVTTILVLKGRAEEGRGLPLHATTKQQEPRRRTTTAMSSNNRKRPFVIQDSDPEDGDGEYRVKVRSLSACLS